MDALQAAAAVASNQVEEAQYPEPPTTLASEHVKDEMSPIPDIPRIDDQRNALLEESWRNNPWPEDSPGMIAAALGNKSAFVGLITVQSVLVATCTVVTVFLGVQTAASWCANSTSASLRRTLAQGPKYIVDAQNMKAALAAVARALNSLAKGGSPSEHVRAAYRLMQLCREVDAMPIEDSMIAGRESAGAAVGGLCICTILLLDFRPLLGSTAGVSALHGNRICLAPAVLKDVRHLVHALAQHPAWRLQDVWPSREIREQGRQLVAAIDILCSWNPSSPFANYGKFDARVMEEIGQSLCTKQELSIALCRAVTFEHGQPLLRHFRRLRKRSLPGDWVGIWDDSSSKPPVPKQLALFSSFASFAGMTSAPTALSLLLPSFCKTSLPKDADTAFQPWDLPHKKFLAARSARSLRRKLKESRRRDKHLQDKHQATEDDSSFRWVRAASSATFTLASKVASSLGLPGPRTCVVGWMPNSSKYDKQRRKLETIQTLDNHLVHKQGTPAGTALQVIPEMSDEEDIAEEDEIWLEVDLKDNCRNKEDSWAPLAGFSSRTIPNNE